MGASQSSPQTSAQYMNSIGAGSGSNQYFGSNTTGQGAGMSQGMLQQLGLA